MYHFFFNSHCHWRLPVFKNTITYLERLMVLGGGEHICNYAAIQGLLGSSFNSKQSDCFTFTENWVVLVKTKYFGNICLLQDAYIMGAQSICCQSCKLCCRLINHKKKPHDFTLVNRELNSLQTIMQSNNSLLCFFLTVLFEIIGRFRFHDNKNDNENDNAISFSFSLRFCTQRG